MIRKSTYMVSFKRVIGWCKITRQYKENHLGVGGRKQVIVIKFIPYICVKDQDMIVSVNRDLIFIIFQRILIIGGITKVKLRPFMDEAFFLSKIMKNYELRMKLKEFLKNISKLP